MLGKILLTLLVIALAVLYIRKRHQRELAQRRAAENPERLVGSNSANNPWRGEQRPSAEPPAAKDAKTPDLRIAAWVTLSVILTVGAGLYYLSWQDARSTVTVILHRDDTQSPTIYQVEKRHLGERAFITVEGTRVTVSANERMEIMGL